MLHIMWSTWRQEPITLTQLVSERREHKYCAEEDRAHRETPALLGALACSSQVIFIAVTVVSTPGCASFRQPFMVLEMQRWLLAAERGNALGRRDTRKAQPASRSTVAAAQIGR